MKRFHVHVAVADLNQAVGFYSTLFDAHPSVLKTDYAKWMLEDPRVNFAISVRGVAPGLAHLGIQVDSASDLQHIADNLTTAGRNVFEQKDEACCYARGDKGWVSDPSGISWETFRTSGEITEYGRDAAPQTTVAEVAACCAPQTTAALKVAESAACCAPTCCDGAKA